ncbi:MAG: hypothetical protein LC794_15070 [Acidobacteria bacterium]|nr:hypothetical protein [Acidobacteriota bacterium]
MANAISNPWNLENFIDSLILELDKAQDTLAMKGLTRKMTYAVKDVGFDLHLFPTYENGKLKFQMAKPGDQGGSRISFQLGSITDRQIRESGNEPLSRDDISIDNLEGMDDEVKDSLRKVGVHSTRDLERMDQRNVNVERVVENKTQGKKKLDYSDLANMINKAKRRKFAPQLSAAQGLTGAEGLDLTLRGHNFVLPGNDDTRFPIALLNGESVQVVAATHDTLRLKAPQHYLKPGANRLSIALDPYAVVNMEINQP